jgi:hypothetical protein
MLAVVLAWRDCPIVWHKLWPPPIGGELADSSVSKRGVNRLRPAGPRKPGAHTPSFADQDQLLWEILLNHLEYVAGLTVHDRSDGVHSHAIRRLWRNKRRHDQLHRSNLDVQ